MTDLKQLKKDFDEAPNDAFWEPGHPIFELAAERDRLLAVYEAAQEVMPIIDRNQVAVNRLREALSRV